METGEGHDTAFTLHRPPTPSLLALLALLANRPTQRRPLWGTVTGHCRRIGFLS